MCWTKCAKSLGAGSEYWRLPDPIPGLLWFPDRCSPLLVQETEGHVYLVAQKQYCIRD